MYGSLPLQKANPACFFFKTQNFKKQSDALTTDKKYTKETFKMYQFVSVFCAPCR
jgi:hypothetical protein